MHSDIMYDRAGGGQALSLGDATCRRAAQANCWFSFFPLVGEIHQQCANASGSLHATVAGNYHLPAVSGVPLQELYWMWHGHG